MLFLAVKLETQLDHTVFMPLIMQRSHSYIFMIITYNYCGNVVANVCLQLQFSY